MESLHSKMFSNDGPPDLGNPQNLRFHRPDQLPVGLVVSQNQCSQQNYTTYMSPPTLTNCFTYDDQNITKINALKPTDLQSLSRKANEIDNARQSMDLTKSGPSNTSGSCSKPQQQQNVQQGRLFGIDEVATSTMNVNYEPLSVISSLPSPAKSEQSTSTHATHEELQTPPPSATHNMPSNSAYICTECGRNCGTAYKMKMHMRIHSGEKPFKCPECGKAFTQSQPLKVHLRIHSGEKPYSCSECGKNFRTSDHLNLHMRTHSGDRPYKCDVCNKCFARSGSLKLHMKIHNGGVKRYKCYECTRTFMTLQDLEIHVRKHTGDSIYYSCSECGKAFTTTSSLQAHMKMHAGQAPGASKFQDPPPDVGGIGSAGSLWDGGAATAGVSGSIGVANKPFRCNECGMCFTQVLSLSSHMNTHEGEKIYKCSQCGKCFTQVVSLKKHLELCKYKGPPFDNYSRLFHAFDQQSQ